MTPVFSLVVPIYKSESNIPQLLRDLGEICINVGVPMEVIFVVDGSPDNSWEILSNQSRLQGFSFKVLLLSRNFGAFSAVRCGLEESSGSVLAVMAADSQEPPSLIVSLFREVHDGGSDIAVGIREGRNDPLVTRILSRAFWSVFRILGGHAIPKRGVDVFAITEHVKLRLVQMNESSTSLIGLLYWMGFKRTEVLYSRQQRTTGRSSWSFRKRVKYALDSITSFSEAPIVLLVLMGLIGSIVALLLSIIVAIRQIVWSTEPAGYAPVMISILLVGSLVMIGLGLLGVYVWRIAETVRNRPHTLVWKREEFNQSLKDESADG